MKFEAVLKFGWLLIPLLNVGLGCPLALGLVPRNHLYGFRTFKTLASPDTWFRVNRIFGIALVATGIVGLICKLLLSRSFPRLLTSIGGALDILLILGAVVVGVIYAKRL